MNIKSVKFNNQEIKFFEALPFIHESVGDYTFQVELIITEVVALKYENEKEIEVSIESTDFKDLSFLMTIDHITEVGNAELPEIFLSGPNINPDEFKDLKIVNWDTPIDEFPRLKKEVTIEEVRAVEMPSREVEITAELPIDLAEWLEWNEHDDDLLKEFLYMYKTKASK